VLTPLSSLFLGARETLLAHKVSKKRSDGFRGLKALG
jgi:hypothetical protein